VAVSSAQQVFVASPPLSESMLRDSRRKPALKLLLFKSSSWILGDGTCLSDVLDVLDVSDVTGQSHWHRAVSREISLHRSRPRRPMFTCILVQIFLASQLVSTRCQTRRTAHEGRT
jgi:hypothetical protein